MQCLHVRCQVVGNHTGFAANRCKCPVLLGRKTGALSQFQVSRPEDQHQKFRVVEGSRCFAQNRVGDRDQLERIGFLRLLQSKLQYCSLSFRSSEVIADRITDPAVCGSLDAAQVLHSGFRDFIIVRADLIVHVIHVAVHILALFLGDLKINAAKRVDRIRKSLESDCHKVRDIQIQVGVKHCDCLLRAAICICSIAFAEFSAADIEHCISVDRYQLDLSGLFMNGADHDRIASVITVKQVLFPRIHTKQRDILVFSHRLVVSDLRTDTALQGLLEIDRID